MKLNAMIALVMMLVMPSVQAHAETMTVKSAIAELNFSITQWDGKDQSFLKTATAKTLQQIAAIQKSGVSQEQVIAELKASLPNAQAAQDVDSMVAVAKAKNLSSAETNKMVMDYLQKSQATGASWSGGASYVLVSLAVVALIVVLVVALNHGSVSVSSGYYYDGYYYNYCGYDDYGNYYCY